MKKKSMFKFSVCFQISKEKPKEIFIEVIISTVRQLSTNSLLHIFLTVSIYLLTVLAAHWKFLKRGQILQTELWIHMNNTICSIAQSAALWYICFSCVCSWISVQKTREVSKEVWILKHPLFKLSFSNICASQAKKQLQIYQLECTNSRLTRLCFVTAQT